jgi:hypothetical protein
MHVVDAISACLYSISGFLFLLASFEYGSYGLPSPFLGVLSGILALKQGRIGFAKRRRLD